MRIVHFLWEFPPVIKGGLGTFGMEISLKQTAMNNDVTVFSLNEGNAHKTIDCWHNIEVYRPQLMDLTSPIHIFSNNELHSWGPNFKFFADLVSYNLQSASYLVENLVRTEGRSFEIIDAHDWLGILGGMVAKKELNLPLIFHVHSTEQGRSAGDGSATIRNIEFAGGLSADRIITVSHAMKEELQHLGFPEKKIRVCWNGVDPSKYDPSTVLASEKNALRRRYGIHKDETMIFFIGRLVTVKGADKLIHAMPSVVQEFPKAKLILLGIGDMETSLKKLVSDLELDGHIIFRNEFVDEHERILHYAASDLVVLPSLYEPFGIVCTEAMSMEKPVVVGARGTNGMREQIVPDGPHQSGVHVNPFDPGDIAWGIKQILQSKEKADRMGKEGRKRVIQDFSWDAVAKRTLDIYKELT